MVIGIDFDGTCVRHEYPEIGKDIGAIPVLKRIIEYGHDIILFTMRGDLNDDNTLNDAVDWFKSNDIPLFGINKNPTQSDWTNSPKAYCNLYIDDSSLGCPLIEDTDVSYYNYVDWKKVEIILTNMGVFGHPEEDEYL